MGLFNSHPRRLIKLIEPLKNDHWNTILSSSNGSSSVESHKSLPTFPNLCRSRLGLNCNDAHWRNHINRVWKLSDGHIAGSKEGADLSLSQRDLSVKTRNGKRIEGGGGQFSYYVEVRCDACCRWRFCWEIMNISNKDAQQCHLVVTESPVVM